MKSQNPMMRFGSFLSRGQIDGQHMTIQGTTTKTIILLACLVSTFALNWYLHAQELYGLYGILSMVGLTAGLILALTTSFKPHLARITAPLYALCQGLVLGAITSALEHEYAGIAVTSVLLTLSIFTAMLLVYKAEIIKVNNTFHTVLSSACGGIFILYMINLLFSLFGSSVGLLHASSPAGIILSLVIIGVAALTLVADFDFIYQASEQGIDKDAEWYASFSLMVSLIWVYMEVLRFVMKISKRR
jgi:uncharacterized YccA/Bax inhibitor family protein